MSSSTSVLPTTASPTPSSFRRNRHQQNNTVQVGEVIGQCDRCLDFFDVVIYRHHKQLYVEETRRVQWRSIGPHDFILQHRPGVCNGKVNLFYGSAERLLPDPRKNART